MTDTTVAKGTESADGADVPTYDALVIGAGVCGIYTLYKLRELGFNVGVIEAGSDVGGTWYWNRYPGARFDSESYTYGYSFSQELLDEWDWSEHFSGQPETLRYLQFVVEKFDLRRDMQFNRRVKASAFDEATDHWEVEFEDGGHARARFLLTAVGMLSAHTMPHFEGMDEFSGQSFHTARWPHEGVDLAGKKVGIIGTGATGVQCIQVIAHEVGELTIFQRRPNWCAPLHNGKITEAEQADIKARYDEIFETCSKTFGGFMHHSDRRYTFDVSEEERLEFWEKLYASPGFGIWMGNFRDSLRTPEANAALSEFVAGKIRQRVKDPETAEKLIPRDHGFGTRRVPLETKYYEVYNQDNVTLVDINETPIEAITSTGLRTSNNEYEFDVIIYATGFDAVTGAFDRIDITGKDGLKLKDKWRDGGPETYLGLQTVGFPNLLTMAGPTSGSVSTNVPRGVEVAVDWVADFLKYVRDGGFSRIEPTPEAEQQWTEHVAEGFENMLMAETKSWFMGFNSNVEGRDKRRYLIYNGGAPAYRKRLESVAESGYEGFVLEK